MVTFCRKLLPAPLNSRIYNNSLGDHFLDISWPPLRGLWSMMMFNVSVLLLGIIVVSVAVLVVVVDIVVVMVIVIGVPLVCTGHVDCLMQGRRLRRSDISFDSFRKPMNVLSNLLAFSGGIYSWTLFRTSSMEAGFCWLSLDIHLLFRVRVQSSCSTSFRFRLCCGVFQFVIHSFHVASKGSD
ncbi:hypothetical protein Tco_0545023 [Tanacetum coccineum]